MEIIFKCNARFSELLEDLTRRAGHKDDATTVKEALKYYDELITNSQPLPVTHKKMKGAKLKLVHSGD